MKVGIIINDTEAANKAIKSFYKSIIESLSKVAIIIIIKNIKMYTKDIDFTLGVGRYNLYVNNIPAYEYFKIHHYNWVLDNPLKLDLDIKNLYITHIMIDNEFKQTLEFSNKNLFLPIGTNLPSKLESYGTKENDITFIGQVRNHNMIFREIRLLNTDIQSKVLQIIDKMHNDLSQSFINCFNNVVEINISDIDKKIIFKFSNSYIRAYKRYFVLNSIKDHPVTIIGEVSNPVLHKKNNLKILSPIPYSHLKEIYTNTKISININPNFNYSCHDRIINSIAYGSVSLTDSNKYITSFFEDGKSILFFDYNNINSVNEKLTNVMNTKEYFEIQNHGYNIVEQNFTWDKILLRLIAHHENRK